MDLDRDGIVEALTELGERLLLKGKIGEVTLFGGAAKLLQFDTRFVTGDIDAVIDAEHGALTEAVRDIGRATSAASPARSGWACGSFSPSPTICWP